MWPPAFGILHVRTDTDADARDCILGAVRADTVGESIDLHKTPGGQSLAAPETVLSLVAFQPDVLLTFRVFLWPNSFRGKGSYEFCTMRGNESERERGERSCWSL